jgi:hypothetical protein
MNSWQRSSILWVVSSLCWLIFFFLLCRSFLVWCIPICQFLFVFPILLETYPGNHCLGQYLEVFPQSYPLWIQSFVSCIKVFDPFWFDFYTGWDIGVKFQYMRVSSFPSTICWRDYTISIVCFWHICQKSSGWKYMDLCLVIHV